MRCATCEDTGFWPFVEAENPTPDDSVTVADLLFAICLCAAGLAWRHAENNGKACAPLWRMWCAREQVDPSRVWRLEDVWTDKELRKQGLTRPDEFKAAKASREAALLAAGRSNKSKR